MVDKPPMAADLFLVVYEELRKVARNYLGRERRAHTLQPTALVNEAWLRLRDARGLDVQGRTHVLALGAKGEKAMRQVLIDHGRGQQAMKRGNRPTSVDRRPLRTDLDGKDDVDRGCACARQGDHSPRIHRRAASGDRLPPLLRRPVRGRSRRAPRCVKAHGGGRVRPCACVAETRTDRQGRDPGMNAALGEGQQLLLARRRFKSDSRLSSSTNTGAWKTRSSSTTLVQSPPK